MELVLELVLKMFAIKQRLEGLHCMHLFDAEVPWSRR